MQKFNFSYDKENDDLFLYSSKSKSKGSIEIGDLIIDYNSNKELVGIQITNASKLLKDLSNEKLPEIKKVLSSLVSCKVDIKARNNILLVRIFLLTNEKEMTSAIPIPNIMRSSPALAYT